MCGYQTSRFYRYLKLGFEIILQLCEKQSSIAKQLSAIVQKRWL